MTEPLFRTQPYLREAPARVIGHTGEGGIILDASLFYPTGGGQPGDAGWLRWQGGVLEIATAIKGEACRWCWCLPCRSPCLTWGQRSARP